ncbi:hypothetical protein [Natronoglomus mannanivorans]|uniref:Uncharacterized protein n=1 Tax=Natronoglomus mannanivorans TaxID=2979990 RepID=A0AAP3E3H9_9EURY|nr:hypothetical protein [Halobacteria archaeon AArc-xg1-1]
MTIHRANCEDCSWSFQGEDLVDVSDEMERHAQKEVGHDVDLERAVATDGGVNSNGGGSDACSSSASDTERGFYAGTTQAHCHHCDYDVPLNTATWLMWVHLLRHPRVFVRLLWNRYVSTGTKQSGESR